MRKHTRRPGRHLRQEVTPRFAAIVDGDNLTHGGQLELPQVRSVLSSVAVLLEDCPVAFAMQSRQAARYLSAYADLRWLRRFASMAPDAADEVLLEDAQFFLERGVTDLWVASGDHAFAELAEGVRLHVVCHRSSLSKRLRLAATTVTYLDGIEDFPAVA